MNLARGLGCSCKSYSEMMALAVLGHWRCCASKVDRLVAPEAEALASFRIRKKQGAKVRNACKMQRNTVQHTMQHTAQHTTLRCNLQGFLVWRAMLSCRIKKSLRFFFPRPRNAVFYSVAWCVAWCVAVLRDVLRHMLHDMLT